MADAAFGAMADAAFEDPRLAAVYDALDPDRSDLAAYAGIAAELRAKSDWSWMAFSAAASSPIRTTVGQRGTS